MQQELLLIVGTPRQLGRITYALQSTAFLVSVTAVPDGHEEAVITSASPPAIDWEEGGTDGSDDPDMEEYWGHGYHAYNATGQGPGRMSFQWFGADAWVFGGYRQRLGSYEVVLDGNRRYDFEGFHDGDTENFNAVLFNATDLDVDYHQLELINTSADSQNSVLDISHIVYQSNSVTVSSVLSTAPECRWGPQGLNAPAWTLDSLSHTTSHALGSMEYNFTVSNSTSIKNWKLSGTGIALYGLTGNNSSPFTVFIDSALSQTYTPNSRVTPSVNDSQLLFVRNDLPQGFHTMTIRNNPQALSNGPNGLIPATLNIQNMVVYASLENTTSPTTTASKHRKRDWGPAVRFRVPFSLAIQPLQTQSAA
ncbi:hypothetical protein NM688_g4091 [Phlebia brevispora]|uniref:Uncharacterized protein n=1 Tax=Phlebia brevispora TaxID=194682 RepID=A0ACC1T422_9APHY|nr:hypothetical protein NM688_g4091 [Phlebia brevispora]